MADPLSAWAAAGAAGSVIQVVEFTTKLVKETYELMNASGNVSKSNTILEEFTLMHANLADQVLRSAEGQSPLSDSSLAVRNLAHECKQASGDLVKLLSELKVQNGLHGSKRAWESARKAQRSLQRRQVIERKQKYLRELTGQLSTALLLGFRNTRVSGTEDILKRVDEAGNRNASLIAESREAILTASKSKVDQKWDVIDSLRFPGIYARRETIPEAYKNTFSWLFANDSPFNTWLQDSREIFWITGKAGSGKSTSMKFIAHHTVAKELLAKWAGDCKAVVAENYMWHPGLAMQHNEEGMLQEILFRVLASDPELVNIIPLFAKPRYMQDREDRFVLAFNHTIGHTRYCLIIDGLDEYEGESSHLIATILTLSKCANIKVCISSRPWNAFRSDFEHLDEKIYIHELTRDDIHTFVQGEIGQLLKDSTLAEELISSIIRKAHGVFLWVFLVIRSLREGFEEGDDVRVMRQGVDEFPADLEDYFRHMLSRLSKTYRHDTAKTLSLAIKLLVKDDPRRIRDSDSLLSFCLLSEGHLDTPLFAFEYRPHCVTPTQLHEMSKGTKRFLNAVCMDFLYVMEPSFAQAAHRDCSLDHAPRVEYLHRTVYDFLHSGEVDQLLRRDTPEHFHHSIFSTYVALARSKVKGQHDTHFCQLCANAIRSIIKKVLNVEQSFRTMVGFEALAVNLLKYACTEDCCSYQAVYDDNLLEDLCITFASYGLRAFIARVSQQFHGCIWDMESVGNREILRAAIGLSSRRPFPTSQIDLKMLHTLLRSGKYRRFHIIRLGRRMGEKAVHEADSWCEADLKHVAEVIKALILYGLNVNVFPIKLLRILQDYIPEISLAQRGRDVSGDDPIDFRPLP